MSWGLPNPQAAAANSIHKKCKCCSFYDKQGHHIQNCETKNKGKWHRAHTFVLNMWKGMALSAIEPSNLPSPATAPTATPTSCLA